MNKSSLAVLGALVFLVGLLMMVSPVLADWNEGDPAKWVQLPDLTSNRVGVLTGGPLNIVLADDFKCTGTGPITGIHLWASYFNDATWNLPYTNFRLSIWDDEPAGPDTFSHPRELLWSMEFKAGEYKLGQYTANLTDGYFFDPLEPTKYLESIEKEVWQFNFSIPAEKAFKQTELTVGKTFWLSVETINDISHLFAWQSADFNQRWNDDAVWAAIPPGSSPAWAPLNYLADHPNPNYRGESMDLAFVITPIPGSLLLLGTGLVGLAGLGWRFRN